MAFKETKEQQSTQSGGVFDLTHKLFEQTVDPKKGDILGRIYKLMDMNSIRPDQMGSFDYVIQQEWQLPGIMSFGFMPTFGVGNSKEDPLNLAGTNLFKKIQNALRKTNLKYQSSDIMMQLMAHDSLFIMYNYIKRAQMTAMYYNPWNRNVGKRIFDAMGLDFDSFIDNGSQINYDLNTWAATLANYPIPTNFPMFGMHSAMISQFFADTEAGDKFQLYIFNPSWVWKYPTYEGTRPATYELDPVHVYAPGNRLTYNQVREIFKDLLNALNTASDFQEINSNLLSTFEGGTVYSVSAPAMTDRVPISYDVNVIEAITNARITYISGEAVAKTWSPKCTANNVIEITPTINGVYEYEVPAYAATVVVNATSDEVDSKRLARCLRWCPVYKDIQVAGSQGILMHVESVATELITCAAVYADNFLSASGALNEYALRSNFIRSNYNGTTDTSNLLMAAISGFRYHPTFYTGAEFVAQDAEAKLYVEPYAQWHYAVEVSRSDVANIDNAYLWQALLTDA